MKLTPETSDIIGVIRFPLCVGVVFIHATTVSIPDDLLVPISDSNPNLFIQLLITRILARIAVPLFFVMSGFLLYDESRLSWDKVREKWIGRFYSLAIPYFIWNSVVVGIQLVGQTWPATRPYFSGGTLQLNHLTPSALLNAYWGIGSGPANHPLWFLRDLIMLVLFSPVLRLGVRRLPLVVLPLTALCWLGFFVEFYPIEFISEGALLFFTLGLWLRIQPSERYERLLQRRRFMGLFGTCFLLLSTAEAWLFLHNYPTFLLHKVNIVYGVLTSYGMGVIFSRIPRLKKVLLYLAPVSYFIYLSHSQVILVIRKLTDRALHPSTNPALLVEFFALTLLTTGSLILLYAFLERYAPNLLSLLSGQWRGFTSPQRQARPPATLRSPAPSTT